MSDDDFLRAFEYCSLPFTHWSHRAHVRVAFLYLSRLDLAEAIDRMRSGIKAYNAVHRVEDGPSTGYHETTTQAFMRLIHEAVRMRGPFQDSHEFCDRNPELLDRRVLLCYYTRDRIMQPATKGGFVEPDIAPLDQIGLAFPEFGKRVEGVSYTLRPGAYALIVDEAGRIAAVTTAKGTYLPGGGQEAGESPIDALKREVLEECGLTIEVGRPIGVADEFVFAKDECQHFCKRCSFYFAVVEAKGSPVEPDHQLIWLAPDEAMANLQHDSHRWAVTRLAAISHGGNLPRDGRLTINQRMIGKW
jgi:8-oxo-dGTP pyrophosphatase MutT (NUDIX family)